LAVAFYGARRNAIVDDEGNELPRSGSVPALHVRRPWVRQGYFKVRARCGSTNLLAMTSAGLRRADVLQPFIPKAIMDNTLETALKTDHQVWRGVGVVPIEIENAACDHPEVADGGLYRCAV